MPEFIRVSYPTARREGWCRACRRPIAIGTEYARPTIAGDGSIWDWPCHKECDREVNRLFADGYFVNDDGAPEGVLVDYVESEDLSAEWSEWFGALTT